MTQIYIAIYGKFAAEMLANSNNFISLHFIYICSLNICLETRGKVRPPLPASKINSVKRTFLLRQRRDDCSRSGEWLELPNMDAVNHRDEGIWSMVEHCLI